MTHSPSPSEKLHYGSWNHDAAGLPCFDADLETNFLANDPFRHLLGTGRMSLFCDQWGNVNPFTTEGGFVMLSPNEYGARSALYARLIIAGEAHSLIYSELSGDKKIRYGTGYAEYSGKMDAPDISLDVSQSFLTPPDKKPGFISWISLKNTGQKDICALMEVQSDIWPMLGRGILHEWTHTPSTHRHKEIGAGFAIWKNAPQGLGSFHLIAATDGWQGDTSDISLILRSPVNIPAGQTVDIPLYFGYGLESTVEESQVYLTENTPEIIRAKWESILAKKRLYAPEPWMIEEARWCTGQLLSFTNYDSSLDEYYIALGGYGWRGFNIREVGETAMALAYWDWELTKSSLRWYAKLQMASGRMNHGHDFRADTPHHPHAHDTDIWFLLGTVESTLTADDPAFLDESCPYWDQGEDSLWDHLKQCFYWLRDGSGTGSHGLLHFPDWDDYLSGVGRLGRGESVMNTGMACRAGDGLALLARKRGGEEPFAQEVEKWVKDLRKSVAGAYDGKWFLRGYTDEGNPFCSVAENRLSLVAQAWAVLGRCGSPAQRKEALLEALSKCHSQIGLILMSRPYSCPPPPEISLNPIPRGEGENGGVWPQTVHWFIWALAQEGLIDEAWEEWKKVSLRNHARKHPKVPFGIFNGPDCFSSYLSGKREGWTQVLLTDRNQAIPMNPMIAWQSFSMIKIMEASEKKSA